MIYAVKAGHYSESQTQEFTIGQADFGNKSIFEVRSVENKVFKEGGVTQDENVMKLVNARTGEERHREEKENYSVLECGMISVMPCFLSQEMFDFREQ